MTDHEPRRLSLKERLEKKFRKEPADSPRLQALIDLMTRSSEEPNPFTFAAYEALDLHITKRGEQDPAYRYALRRRDAYLGRYFTPVPESGDVLLWYQRQCRRALADLQQINEGKRKAVDGPEK